MTDTFKKAVLATRKLFGFDISPKPSPHLRARATSQDSSLRQGSKRKAVIDLRQIRKRPRYMGNRYEEADLYEGSEARKSMRRKGKQLGDRMHKQATRYPNVNGTGSVGVTTLRGMDVDTFKQATQDTVEDITEIIMDSGFPPDTKVHALREVAEELTDEARHVKDIANDIRPYPSGDILESTWTTPVPAPTTPDVDEYEDETPWDHEPNSQARKVLASVNGDVRKARRFIQMDFQRNGLIPEPEYALREAEIRDGLWQVMDKMEQFTKKYFDFTGFNDVPKNRTILHERFLKHLQPETIRVIGFVASGGPGGDDGWRELFFNRQKRRALICAIIGNVVTEQVYQHAFFGGQDREMRQLEEIQIEHHNDDGFDRNSLYAKHVTKVLGYQPRKSMDLQLPSGFHNHVLRIVQGIDNHLEIFRELSDSAGGHKYVLESYVAELYGLVAHAGILSLLMRIDPHTVYRVTPVLKEDSFRPKYMQCFNNANMEAEDPRDRKDWTGIPPGEIHMRKDDKPVTQIIVMDGITAYRLGGWEKSESKVWDVKYDDKNYDHKRGIRSQLLAHGWVFCRWGRPRKFEGGKEIKNPKIHGSAWKDGGFVEFEDVEGVRRPKKSKASSKGNTTKKEKAKVV